MIGYLKAQADFPGVRCDLCRRGLEEHGVEPDCFEGSCITGYDKLTSDELKILKARSMIVGLSEYKLGSVIAREMNLSLEELCLIAELEEVVRELQPKPEIGDSWHQ